ncbi:MAG: iron-containing alcohol dehydrogenase [Deltaproteobacteria bacterium]|nr:iron-containing alcohol dehydrogenase [Deltaproteobacteria bacterium]MBW2087348.1 iron-containing alcohol dehydrogenase [Deltaproteobacteria bacterium]
MSNGITSFSFAFDGQFGVGSINNIGKTAQRLGIKKPVIVCDPTMVQLGFAQKVSDLLAEAGIEAVVFDQCVENPRVEDISAGAAVFKENNCDGVIGLGGGSPLDQAKVIRVVANYGGSALDYDVRSGGLAKIGQDMAPMIAVPTTSGTGSEVTLAAVITDSAKHFKFVVFSPYLKNSMAILDPELTKSMPSLVTAATGFDVIVHAIESYVVDGYNPIADSLNRTCFELVGQSLKKAVTEGQDLEARSDMMMASMLAGMAFTLTGLGAVHALAHPLGGIFGIAHGTANSLMLPHVMRFNASVAESRYIEAAGLIGFKVASADGAAEAMLGLAKDVGLPVRLSEAGVTEDELPQLATDAFNDVSLGRNPVKCSEADLLELYKKAM